MFLSIVGNQLTVLELEMSISCTPIRTCSAYFESMVTIIKQSALLSRYKTGNRAARRYSDITKSHIVLTIFTFHHYASQQNGKI